ncbi:hypothetical protein K491DRAFT_720031 [Lophiostoma macrostomum CBS 122681]|uniref:F-box domain-containing protein n=1 Tax=Lophiostoma macrostomum CBS 122681 TaxID=1314788 RepID=A0A6A6SYE8_9PLEO|nr:hypothetical protein K491DRAFT_720031 [Lophiostoma macrostomum CBS 122681]
MSGLPTEVDKIIVHFLDREELEALCLTSKYYNDLAEPFLYTTIRFHTKDLLGPYLLTRTLFDRPYLADCIKTLEVYQKHEISEDPESSTKKEESFLQRVSLDVGCGEKNGKEQLPALKKQLQDESQSYASAVARAIFFAWPSLNGNCKNTWMQNFHLLDMDACISLIVTMALNLEVLTWILSSECHFSTMPLLLVQVRSPMAHGTADRRAFSRLRTLNVIAEELDAVKGRITHWVPYAPSNELYVRNLWVDHIEYPLARPIAYVPTIHALGQVLHPSIPMPTNFVPTLQVLEMDHVMLYPDDFAQELCLGYFWNLQHLTLRKVSNPHDWSNFPYEEFSEILSKYCPRLRLLHVSVWWDEPSLVSAHQVAL